MNEKREQPSYLEVAGKVTQFLAETYGEDVTDPEILEGLWLAMQMVGSPSRAAIAMRNYVFKVD